MDKDKYLLSSVSNTLDVLELLSKHKYLTLSEISEELNLGKASVFRMLYTLNKKQFVQKTADAKYELGIKFAHFGAKVIERKGNLKMVRPFLETLRDEYHETVHLSILDEDYDIIVIDKAKSDMAIQMSSKVGGKLPAYCSAMGKVLLADKLNDQLKEQIQTWKLEKKTAATITDPEALIEDLEIIKKNGYGMDLEESEVGLVCYAAPIKGIDKATVAAISFSGPAARMKENKEELIEAIKRTAEEISKQMGYMG